MKAQCNRSNNTNKLSPQELLCSFFQKAFSSNNTNKLSPQEHLSVVSFDHLSSNNTNKLSPQEPNKLAPFKMAVQIIQINLVLKNRLDIGYCRPWFK